MSFVVGLILISLGWGLLGFVVAGYRVPKKIRIVATAVAVVFLLVGHPLFYGSPQLSQESSAQIP